MPAIIKPSKISAALQPGVVTGGNVLTVSAFLLFDIARPYALFTEQALWPMVAEQMPDGGIFDKGQLKPKAEIIVAGHALAPGHQPVTGLRIKADFAGRSKQLAVFGDRFWRLTDRGVELVGPTPFDAMPISETRAFGGEGFQANPRGKGFGAQPRIDAGLDVALPNIELAGNLILSPGDTPQPAHFGPIGPDNPDRLKHAGTYDTHWVEHVSPGKPADFNPLFHCDAPSDQRFDAYLTGGETFSVTGMSRSGEAVAGTLPRLRVRAFCHHLNDDGLSETRMVCETATIFPNVNKAAMTFRGLAACEDLFADDIGAVMLAVEHTDAAPRPDDYYSHIFRLRMDPETGYKHALSDHQLLPQPDPAIRVARRAERLERARQERQTFLENSDWLLRKTMAKTGMPSELLPPPDPGRGQDMPLIGLPTPEEFASGDIDIAELIEDVEALERDTNALADEMFANADLVQRSVDEATPAELNTLLPSRPIAGDRHVPVDSAPPADPALQAALQALQEGPASLQEAVGSQLDLDKLREGSSETKDKVQQLLAGLADLTPSAKAEANEQYELACARALQMPEGSPLYPIRRQLESVQLDVDVLPADLNQPLSILSQDTAPKLDLPSMPPDNNGQVERVDLSAPLAKAGQMSDGSYENEAATLTDALAKADELLGGHCSHLVAEGDLAPPLEGMLKSLNALEFPEPENPDLPIVDQLEQVNQDMKASLDALEPRFTETIATGRHLSPQALFPQEPLLPGVAVAAGTLVARKLAQGHDFKGADLAGLSLCGLDFSGRDLSGTFFEQADLTGACFKNCRLDGAVFTAAKLNNTDFEGSQLVDVNLGGASLRDANLSGATLSQSTVICSDLTGVQAQNARIETVTFLECTLDDADFTGSRIRQMKVTRGSAGQLKIGQSVLESVLFIDLPLHDATFAASRMRQVVFTQVAAKNADFTAADMYEAGFHGGCDLAAAKFERIDAVDSCWNGAYLEESLYLQANCRSCLFNQCDMRWIDGRAASFKNARFLQTDLKHSDLTAADFYAASLSQTDLRQASMRHANLFGADLTEARLASCDLSNANLGNTAIHQAVSVTAH